MKTYIKSSFALMSTTILSSCNSASVYGWFPSSFSRFLWGDCSSVASYDLSLWRSFPRSIADSLTVLYSYGAGVIPKGRIRHRRTRLSTMVNHVDAIHLFA